MISEMALLRGKPISVDGLFQVYPATLEEISEITEEMYNYYSHMILLDKGKLMKSLGISNSLELEKISGYELIRSYAHKDIDFRRLYLEAISFFIHEKVFFDEVSLEIYVVKDSVNFILTEKHVNQIKQIVKKQNFLSDKEEKELNPANEKAAELIEKMKQVKAKLAKQKEDETLSLSDIIQIVACYSQDINILNVWDLTVYQLYVAYIRLIMWDDYHSKNILLPHVDSKNLDMKHWATKLNIKNN